MLLDISIHFNYLLLLSFSDRISTKQAVEKKIFHVSSQHSSKFNSLIQGLGTPLSIISLNNFFIVYSSYSVFLPPWVLTSLQRDLNFPRLVLIPFLILLSNLFQPNWTCFGRKDNGISLSSLPCLTILFLRFLSTYSGDITTAIATKLHNQFIMVPELSFLTKFALSVTFNLSFNFIFSSDFNNSGIFFNVISGNFLIMGSHNSFQSLSFVSINFMTPFLWTFLQLDNIGWGESLIHQMLVLTTVILS